MAALISLIMGRLARRQSLTRMTPEFAGVLALGAVILLTAPFSIWFGGAVGVFPDALPQGRSLVYLLAVNVLISPKRLERLTWLLVARGRLHRLPRGLRLRARRQPDRARHAGAWVRSAGSCRTPTTWRCNMVVFLPLAALLAMRAGLRLQAPGRGAAAALHDGRDRRLGLARRLPRLRRHARRPGRALPCGSTAMFVAAGVLVVICALPLVAELATGAASRASPTTSKDDVQSSQARKRADGRVARRLHARIR